MLKVNNRIMSRIDASARDVKMEDCDFVMGIPFL
jgi:uncharacterized ferredoxin-like protein